MLRNTLTLVALVMIVPLAPATANRQTVLHRSACPLERAREAAAAARMQHPVKIATTVTLPERLPAADRWFIGLAPASGILNP